MCSQCLPWQTECKWTKPWFPCECSIASWRQPMKGGRQIRLSWRHTNVCNQSCQPLTQQSGIGRLHDIESHSLWARVYSCVHSLKCCIWRLVCIDLSLMSAMNGEQSAEATIHPVALADLNTNSYMPRVGHAVCISLHEGHSFNYRVAPKCHSITWFLWHICTDSWCCEKKRLNLCDIVKFKQLCTQSLPVHQGRRQGWPERLCSCQHWGIATVGIERIR